MRFRRPASSLTRVSTAIQFASHVFPPLSIPDLADRRRPRVFDPGRGTGQWFQPPRELRSPRTYFEVKVALTVSGLDNLLRLSRCYDERRWRGVNGLQRDHRAEQEDSDTHRDLVVRQRAFPLSPFTYFCHSRVAPAGRPHGAGSVAGETGLRLGFLRATEQRLIDAC